MRKHVFLLCLLFLFGGYGFSQIATVDPAAVQKTTLPNGFEVFLIEDHSAPNIFGAVVVKAGGKYDPKDATGMGHYLEHMLFKGTNTMGTSNYEKEKPFLDKIDALYEELGKTTDEVQRKAIQTQINENAVAAAEFAIPNELDRMLESIGSEGVNAFTDYEQIVYHNSFPPNQVEKWLDIYAARFQNPVFRLFQSELETVYEEKNRAMDEFTYKVFQKFIGTFFKNHPYGQQEILGLTDHLKNPSLTKMYDYFNTYYVANNMALVMSGDFESEKILPMIRAKFGVLKQGNVPKFPEYPETPFKGREYVSGNYTPVKAGIMGFRTVPNGHPDQPALDLVSHLLYNEGETGFLNKLQLDHEVLAALVMAMDYNDHGGNFLIIIPKIIGQSTENAEGLVLAALQKLKNGEFSEATLQAAKLKLRLDFERSLETNNGRGLMMADAFVQGRKWEEFVDYPKKIGMVTKQQVVDAAIKYYGQNYLMFESKMGFPKKEKLEKPGFVAPKPQKEAQSDYARHFYSLPEQQPKAQFVDFEKDFKVLDLGPNARLHHVQNPLNGIFNLRIAFAWGTDDDPMLEQATQYLGMVGTESMATDSLKRSFAILGCTYYVMANAHQTIIECSGPEENMVESLKLLSDLVWHPDMDPKKIEAIYDAAKSDRKFEARSVAETGDAAIEFALYGKNSPMVRRLSLKATKALTAKQLIANFVAVRDHAVEVHYSGRKTANWVAEALQSQFFKGNYPGKAANYKEIERIQYDTPTVIFVERGDAIQTQLHFFKEGLPFDRDNAWLADCFNEYFGGSMAGLVFQEIREFRSLAYTARARLNRPQVPNGNMLLRGYIGCQADKTLEAMEVMNMLLTAMPEKPERADLVKKSCTESAYMARPNFRNLTETVVEWQRIGYQKDPWSIRVTQYGALSWEKLREYYARQIQNSGKPIVWVLTGDPKRIDMEALAKFGKVVKVKESEIRTN